jgi:hypothetical protein
VRGGGTGTKDGGGKIEDMDELMDILRKLEWFDVGCIHVCPVCRQSKQQGHRSDCILDEYLRTGHIAKEDENE